MKTQTYYTTEERKNNIFVEEYYSSPDVSLRMDGKEQKEISYLAYNVQEQLKPIYGYASRTYDDVAVGNRLIVGTFKVPIKNPNNSITEEAVSNVQYGNWATISSIEQMEKLNYHQELVKGESDWADDAPVPDTEDVPKDEVTELVDIRKYQQMLLDKGYILSVTGYYDSVTIVQIKLFQHEHRLKQTGLFDKPTISLLISYIPDGTHFVTVKACYLRSCPGFHDDMPAETYAIRELMEGEEGEILSDTMNNNHYYVKMKVGRYEGWIHKSYLNIKGGE